MGRSGQIRGALAAAAALVAGTVAAVAGHPAGAVTVPGGCSYSTGIVTCTYTTQVNLTVPAGVTKMHLSATGGTGSPSSTGGVGGMPATVLGDVTVTPGTSLGARPGTSGSGRFGGVNGGGTGGSSDSCTGGGGGGYSSVLDAGGATLIQAAGGGGAGCGSSGALPGGNAGQSAPNGIGANYGNGGGAGLSGGGGLGGSGPCGNGLTGGFNVGGTGASAGGCAIVTVPTAGGGGGGGRFGGGGGGAGQLGSSGGGGGGGSSFISAQVSNSGSVVSNSGPRVVISWSVGSATVSPGSVDFGSYVPGIATSAPVPVTFAAHNGPVTLGPVSLSGSEAGDFTLTDNTCVAGSVLADGGSCSVSVVFDPGAVGQRTASLSFPSDATNGTQTVDLEGTGAARSGTVRIHGFGSVYTGTKHTVSLGVLAGKAATYAVQIANLNASASTFSVHVGAPSGNAASVDLLSGSTSVGAAATGAAGWTTPAVSPTKPLALKLRVTPAAGDPQGITAVTVSLSDLTGMQLDRVLTLTNVEAPKKGTTGYDLFAKSGTQPNVGGSFSGQTMTAATLKTATSKAVYKVVLKNEDPNTALSTFIGFALTPGPGGCSGAFPVIVKDGSSDVTAAALAGSYATPALKAGKSKTLTVTVTFHDDGTGCTAGVWQAASRVGQNGAVAVSALLNTNLP